MNEVENYGLEHVHSLLLEGAIKFDALCRDNDISYSLHGGTLLGAERNHKFIPWDDDVDVSMKRSEYKKFQDVAKNLPDDFKLDDETTWVPRLIIKRDDMSVCIDIFVYDYISSRPVFQKMKINILRLYQGMMKRDVELNNFTVKEKGLLLVTYIMGKFIPYKSKIKQFKYLCENLFCGDELRIHRANDSFKGVGEVFAANCMDEYEDIVFEDYKFMVNKRYREILVTSYGEDYLTPPSKEKRIPSHNVLSGKCNYSK